MRLSEVLRRLEAEEIVPASDYDVEVRNVCASDMLSDILATEKMDFVLLTGLTTVQVMRTAEISGAIAVVLVRNKLATMDTVNFAKAKDIPLARCRFPMFEACVRLADLKR